MNYGSPTLYTAKNIQFNITLFSTLENSLQHVRRRFRLTTILRNGQTLTNQLQ